MFIPITTRKSGIIRGTEYRNAPAVLETPRGVAPQIGAVMRKHSIPSITEDTTEEIPYGYCHCGCGQKTSIAKQSRSLRGDVRGEPRRYLKNHDKRTPVKAPSMDTDAGVARIYLGGRKYSEASVVVDISDFPLVSGIRWYARNGGNTIYAASHSAEVQTSLSTDDPRKTILMHRWILGVTDPHVEVDHINGNGLDNRRCNLRLAIRAENARNQPNRSMANRSSEYRGVTWNKNVQKWQAQISKEGRPRYIGVFVSEDDAARAYNEVALDLFGEFASLNEVES